MAEAQTPAAYHGFWQKGGTPLAQQSPSSGGHPVGVENWSALARSSRAIPQPVHLLAPTEALGGDGYLARYLARLIGPARRTTILDVGRDLR